MTLNRYQPPSKDTDRPSIDNSQDTALFHISNYQYILSGVVLSVGAPFRESMTANGKSTAVQDFRPTNDLQSPSS